MDTGPPLTNMFQQKSTVSMAAFPAHAVYVNWLVPKDLSSTNLQLEPVPLSVGSGLWGLVPEVSSGLRLVIYVVRKPLEVLTSMI